MNTQGNNNSSSAAGGGGGSMNSNSISPADTGNVYDTNNDARNGATPNMLAPFAGSIQQSNAPEPDYGDISSQQLEVSTLSERVYANNEIETELINIIKQLNRLISANQVKINNINNQIGISETGLAATSIDVRRMAQNVAAYTAMTIYYGMLLNNIQKQLQERLHRTLSEDVLRDLAASRKIIGDIQQIFDNLRTQEIIKLTPDEWSELQRVIEQFIQRKETQRWLMQKLKSVWESVRDTSIERGSAALASISSAVTPFVRPAGAAYAGATSLQTASYMSMGGELVLYVPPTTSINSLIQYVPTPLLRIYRFLISSNYYVVRFMAGGARLVITNPILSISVVSLLTIYATLPTYAQTRIRGAIVFLLRVIFIQTPTVGLNTVMMIFNSIVVPLWQIINWLVAAPGQAVMALFNLFSSTSNRSWDAMTRWVAGMWSYITNSPMVSLARTMITGSSMPTSSMPTSSSSSTSSMSTSSMPTFSRSSSDAAAQRAELATLLTSQLEAIPKSPSSNSSNAASSSSAQATTSGFQAASNSNQEFTVTASTGLNATPMPNLTFTATAPENTTAEAAITQTISSLNENSTQQEVNSETSSLTASLTPPDQASVPSPEQLRDTTTTLVEAVVNAGDAPTVREIRNTSRNNTPANSQVPGEEPVSPQNASIAAAALEVLDKSITMGTKRKDEDEDEDEETAGTPRGSKPRTDDDDDDEGVTGGRRKSRRRRTRSTKKRPIRRSRSAKRRNTKRRRSTKRRATKRRR